MGTQLERSEQAESIDRQVAERGGEIADRYTGHSFTALRVIGSGLLVRWLLSLSLVRVVDSPPEADADVEVLLDTGIRDLGTIGIPDNQAPLIGILDSGINSGHPLLTALVVDRLSASASLGINDIFGHGTRVSGVAAFGDVRACLENGIFQPQVRLLSGKVVNDSGNFDERRLVPSQMNEIIRALHARGCRIFNLSLGDHRARYRGGKVGMWTAILDELARELDILIVVAVGNYQHQPSNGNPEDHLLGYPRYLITSESRLFEPAVSANVLTVGAIAHAAALNVQDAHNVSIRPIAAVGEPASFTRCGPGVQEAQKPDLCDDGGNVLYDGNLQGLAQRAESEILTTHPRYLERLFTTALGTSYAAPLVAHKAALVLKAMPNASANLLRALLVSSAKRPDPAVRRLSGLGATAIPSLCGYGIAQVVGASTSDRHRVVLYADAEIGMDRFFVYEVPVPAESIRQKAHAKSGSLWLLMLLPGTRVPRISESRCLLD